MAVTIDPDVITACTLWAALTTSAAPIAACTAAIVDTTDGPESVSFADSISVTMSVAPRLRMARR